MTTPALAVALDPGAMSERLRPFLERGSGVDAAGLVGTPTPDRAVVAYETSTPHGAGPSLIGKVYAEPARAARLHGLLVTLDELVAAGHGCRVPRPIAHLPELGISVYVAASGRPLDELDPAARHDGIAAAASWLASLHTMTIAFDRRLDVTTEVANLGEWAQLVAREHPSGAVAVGELGTRLRTAGARTAFTTDTAMHKDFHHRHTLVHDGRVVVIDLDEMRAGDAAFDVAHFGANLRFLGHREGMAEDDAARLEATFTDRYTSLRDYERDERHDFCRAYTFLKLAKQLVRGRGPAPATTGDELTRHLDFVVDQGLRCLGP